MNATSRSVVLSSISATVLFASLFVLPSPDPVESQAGHLFQMLVTVFVGFGLACAACVEAFRAPTPGSARVASRVLALVVAVGAAPLTAILFFFYSFASTWTF